MGGTLFVRSDDKAMRGAAFDAKIGKYMYFFRPGHDVFLKSVSEHPRLKLAFYSSIMFKNIQPVMLKLLKDDLEHLTNNFTVFDQKYNKKMIDHPYYQELKK